MRIDIVFDTVCPWCFVGQRRLDQALAQRPGLAVEVRHHPFLLNPDMPAGGIDRRLYLDRKFGGAHRARRVLDAVTLAGRSAGIAFNFEAIRRMPNSVDSHRLLLAAGQGPLAGRLLDTVFRAYFQHGEDIGDRRILRRLASEAGLCAERLEAELGTSSGVVEVMAANSRAHAMGVAGVPTFIFDHAYAVAGAQEPDVLLRLIDLALETGVKVPVTVG
ncbi:DsbA family oxidoreductase [Roseospira visakhapatnamensis]|uniref:Putative DsbA family dithiol-disulfide isomerase n=1 Tax=Roseospira visakhapatnamensis TaxID=390880 RepID=A0A7W6RFL2_9PROT|nr:DsbA family oxidoreductase [Roseospira visakhapatnamensis]MBB4267670.1 putative DsbA family dithiol-disulfide isomerase [Roseospira visakhapatnamensis]